MEVSDVRGSDTRHYIRMIQKGHQLLKREASAFFLGQHGVFAALHPRHDELFALGVLAHARQKLMGRARNGISYGGIRLT
jgi:hypothetical protein